MSYLKGLGNSVQSQVGFKKWPISDVDPLPPYKGSNLSMHIIKSAVELNAALSNAANYGNDVLIEEFI